MPTRTSRHRTVHTLRQAAWTLGVSTDDLAGAIRRGAVRTGRRRTALVVPGAELARHLHHATDPHPGGEA